MAMSTCPEKDIHSLYLDNELPAAYMEKYEAHIASCEKCRAELNKLKAVHSVFQNDSRSMDFSQKDLDSSFERLQARLSYSSHVEKNVVKFNPRSRVYAVAGAAAALAVFVVPARFRAGPEKSSPAMASSGFVPATQVAMQIPTGPSMQFDGELSGSTIASLFEDGEVVDTDVGISPFSAGIGAIPCANPFGVAQTASKSSEDKTLTSLARYDVFTPVTPPAQEDNVASEKNTFSVEFSLGNFYFKAQGSGK